MSAKWEDFLYEGSFKGIKFDFVSARNQGGNELDVQTFPGRNGARVEKRRRKELRIEVMAIFIEENYPENMFDLLAKLQDGTPGELVHPVYGSIQAAAEAFVDTHDAEDAVDCGTIQITFVEHTENVDQVFDRKDTVAGKANETRSNADSVNTSAANYVEQIAGDIAENASLAVAYTTATYLNAVATQELCTAVATAASETADQLEQDGDEMSSAEVQSVVNSVLSSIDSLVRTLADYATAEAYDLSRVLLLMAASLDDLAIALIETKPPLITEMVQADIPLLLYVHAKYGDSSRVDELLTLNTFSDPLLLTAGTMVKRYAV